VQRRTGRRVMELKLSVELILDSGETEVTEIQNLGPDGAFVGSRAEVTQGDPLRIQFKVASFPLPMKLHATVRWIQAGTGFGVHFDELGSYDRAALDDYCQNLLEKARRIMRSNSPDIS
jgi:hypothetical protein